MHLFSLHFLTFAIQIKIVIINKVNQIFYNIFYLKIQVSTRPIHEGLISFSCGSIMSSLFFPNFFYVSHETCIFALSL